MITTTAFAKAKTNGGEKNIAPNIAIFANCLSLLIIYPFNRYHLKQNDKIIFENGVFLAGEWKELIKDVVRNLVVTQFP